MSFRIAFEQNEMLIGRPDSFGAEESFSSFLEVIVDQVTAIPTLNS